MYAMDKHPNELLGVFPTDVSTLRPRFQILAPYGMSDADTLKFARHWMTEKDADGNTREPAPVFAHPLNGWWWFDGYTRAEWRVWFEQFWSILIERENARRAEMEKQDEQMDVEGIHTHAGNDG